MRILRHILLAWCLFAPTLARTADPPGEIPLWPGTAPGSEGKTAPEGIVPSTDGVRRINSVHKPSVTPYLPSKDKATGAAVIVVPGGGHRYLAIDKEGHAVAKWMSEQGIAGFVLKYRLAREEGSTYTVEEHALRDVQRAIRRARSRAKEWGIDPERVGAMGFSAGGQIVGQVALRFDSGRTDANDPVERESSRPAFQALLYPGTVSADGELPRDAPPAFFCVAADDAGPAGNSLDFFRRLRDRGIAAELHVYARGGHGFGLLDRPLPITGWPLRFHEWMADQGLLTRRSTSP